MLSPLHGNPPRNIIECGGVPCATPIAFAPQWLLSKHGGVPWAMGCCALGGPPCSCFLCNRAPCIYLNAWCPTMWLFCCMWCAMRPYYTWGSTMLYQDCRSGALCVHSVAWCSTMQIRIKHNFWHATVFCYSAPPRNLLGRCFFVLSVGF